MTSIRTAFVLAVLLASGPVLAHGSEGHEGNASKALPYGEPGDSSKPGRVVEIAMSEGDGHMKFTPSVITIAKGEQVKLQFTNEGALDHEFFLGTAAEIEEHADMMLAMPDMKHNDPNAIRVAPKAKGEIVWRFTNAGEFEFACMIPGHKQAGMEGKIVVQ